MSELNRQRWDELVRRLGARPEPAAFERLAAAYGEPRRAYHNASHLAACLKLLDRVRDQAERPDEVELALWFHDAVCDPRATDNEERSAGLAAGFLREGGADPAVGERVRDLVLATRPGFPLATPDERLIADIDLAVLARSEKGYERYASLIRREYDWLSPADYRRGRGEALEKIAGGEHIFHTAYFRDFFELQARDNIAREIQDLITWRPPPWLGIGFTIAAGLCGLVMAVFFAYFAWQHYDWEYEIWQPLIFLALAGGLAGFSGYWLVAALRVLAGRGGEGEEQRRRRREEFVETLARWRSGGILVPAMGAPAGLLVCAMGILCLWKFGSSETALLMVVFGGLAGLGSLFLMLGRLGD